MEIPVLSYLAYNFLIGIFFSISYYKTENGLNNKKQFWWLLLFPAIGLGKWKFSQRLTNESIAFPEKWFIYKYMIKVNWGFIIIIGIISFLMILAFEGLFGSGMNWAGNQDNPEAIGFGLLADIGIGFLFFIFFFLALFGFAFLLLIFIFIPKHLMKKIETETYKQKYFETKLNNNP